MENQEEEGNGRCGKTSSRDSTVVQVGDEGGLLLISSSGNGGEK